MLSIPSKMAPNLLVSSCLNILIKSIDINSWILNQNRWKNYLFEFNGGKASSSKKKSSNRIYACGILKQASQWFTWTWECSILHYIHLFDWPFSLKKKIVASMYSSSLRLKYLYFFLFVFKLNFSFAVTKCH